MELFGPNLDPIQTQPLSKDRLRLLRAQAASLEAAFLAEMLGHAGLSESEQSGGHFGSYLRAAHAEAIVDQGGIGLSHAIFNALARREGGSKDAVA